MTELPGLSALVADPLTVAIFEGRREGILILDYDGTLAPFAVRRDLAVPYPGVVEVLARLPRRGSGRFVVVSGREAGEVGRFLQEAGCAEIWGCHGAQRQLPDGTATLSPLAPRLVAALDRAEALATEVAPVGALERKPTGMALHWRGLDGGMRQRLEARVKSLWDPLADAAGMELQTFNGGLELRLREYDKGLAVKALQRENPGAALVYFGDDRTDEDAFRALGPDGLGVLALAGWRPTTARYRITPPGELLRFLRLWAAACPGAKL